MLTNLSKHPFEAFIPPNSTKLIIGTIPPARFCFDNAGNRIKLDENDVDFYYGSKDNSFWELLGQSFNIQFKNGGGGVEQRKNFLSERKIGITDVIETCARINGSASDEDLTITSFKDIKTILQANKTIDTLIYTSEFVKTKINELYKTYHSIDKLDRKKQSIKFENRIYAVWILYSPSPQALINMGKDGNEKRLEQYKKVFTT